MRVIYLHTPEASRVDLILVYGKDERDDLSRDELRATCAVAREIRNGILRETRSREAKP